jgi:hypothetical protein
VAPARRPDSLLDCVTSSDHKHMTVNDIERIPPYYRSQIRTALTTAPAGYVRELIANLVRIRDDHAEVARHERELIARFDTDELRAGREEVIELTRNAGTFCEHVEKAADDVLSALAIGCAASARARSEFKGPRRDGDRKRSQGKHVNREKAALVALLAATLSLLGTTTSHAASTSGRTSRLRSFLNEEATYDGYSRLLLLRECRTLRRSKVT